MSVIGHSALVGAAGNQGGYQISRSLRFRNSASAYLSRTPASNGSQTKWTASFWYKPGRFGSQQPIITSYTSVNNYAIIGFSLNAFYNANDTLKFLIASSGVTQLFFETTAVYRDPSAWYHVVVAVDTTQATSTNRVLIYVNGVQVTSFITATYPALNASLVLLNTTNPQQIGALATGTYGYYDGYMAEFNWIDGQQLTPSSFGETDAVTGVWNPKRYSGTYGTNGFYLPFNNTTSTTTLVQDSSGNGNNWTPNNISLTAGTTYDSMIDSPTNSASSSNYCVLNPLNRSTSALPATVVDGNLKLTTTTSGAGSPGSFSYAMSTMIMDSGKYYAEFTPVYFSGSAGSTKCGLTNNFTFNYNGGNYIASNFTSAYTQQAPGNIVQVAYDATNGLYWFGVNGTFTGNPSAGTGGTSLTAPAMFFVEGYNDSVNRIDVNANFGQRPFSYTPPTGFNALNTYNLPAPSIANGAQYMAATTYTGNGGTQSVTNGGNNTLGITFQPDLVWVKNRSYGAGNVLSDSVRGSSGGKYYILESDATSPESDFTSTWYGNYGYLSAINSNGFTAVNGSLRGNYNTNSDAYVAWQWKGGGTAVTNNSGTISSQVSANTSAGISILTYTGTGANATIGHGLGVAPSMVIVKARNLPNSIARPWAVWHTALSATEVIFLNDTAAKSTGATTYWNSTLPTSSVFSVGTEPVVNGATGTVGQYVAYCFSAVRGYSAFGSYTGNGSTDGPFIYTGFRPRLVLTKCSSNTANTLWTIWDTSRNTYNASVNELYPNSSSAELVDSSGIDILSNGFKPKRNSEYANFSGWTYIYAAFAENPFNYSRAR